MNPVGIEPPREAQPASTSSNAVVWIVVISIVGVLFLCGIGGAVGVILYKRNAAGLTGPASAGPTAKQTFTSRDGIVSMVAPSTWKRIGGDDLSPAVDLGVCSAAEDVLVFNVNEAASDFEEHLGVGEYAEIVKKLYGQNMKATFRGAETLELAGYPATRFPFEGSYGGIRLRGYLFALRSSANFHHVVVATVPSDFDRLIGTGLSVVSTMTIGAPRAGTAPTQSGTNAKPAPAASRL
ncbi:MAG TPA: hypothetical protein VF103_03940 [Polyangiaceae bacterium]